MSPLAKDRDTDYSLGDLLGMPVQAGVRIFGGALVCSDGEGYAVPAADEPGHVFEGVATAEADNRNGAAGDVSVVVRRRGRYLFGAASPMHQVLQGAYVYAKDDETVGRTGDVRHRVACGRIDKIANSREVWMLIDFFTGRATSRNEGVIIVETEPKAD